MICAHRATLGGRQMDQIDPAIVIQRIEEPPPKEQITTALLAGGGSRITGRRRESLDVTIKFGIDIRKQQMAEREAIIEKINEWARPGGLLRISQKPERRLRVILATPAAVGDPWDWTASYSLVFRAVCVPFWEQETPISAVTGVSTSGSCALAVEGSAETRADVTLENRSGAEISTCSITVGSSTMSFSGLGMKGGESLVLDHTEQGILRIRIRNGSGSYRSVILARTGADDFAVSPGSVTARFTAQRACQMTVSARGRFA